MDINHYEPIINSLWLVWLMVIIPNCSHKVSLPLTRTWPETSALSVACEPNVSAPSEPCPRPRRRRRGTPTFSMTTEDHRPKKIEK